MQHTQIKSYEFAQRAVSCHRCWGLSGGVLRRASTEATTSCTRPRCGHPPHTPAAKDTPPTHLCVATSFRRSSDGDRQTANLKGQLRVEPASADSGAGLWGCRRATRGGAARGPRCDTRWPSDVQERPRPFSRTSRPPRRDQDGASEMLTCMKRSRDVPCREYHVALESLSVLVSASGSFL
eukprot:320758-Rhodomonas_salina.1